MEKSSILKAVLLTPVALFLLYFGWFRDSANRDRSVLPESSPPPKRLPILGGYFAEWSIYDRNFYVADINAGYLSHILYAFANIAENGTVILGDPWADTDIHFEKEHTVNGKGDKWMANVNNLYGNFKQFYFVKSSHRNLKVSLSIGGWSWSTNYPSVASDKDKRKQFALSAAQHVEDLGLDGIDIDWEFPKTEQEGRSFVALLEDVRAALDDIQQSPDSPYLLSIAVGCGPDNYRHLRLHDMDHYLDMIYLMCYDLAGPWDETTGHQAALYRNKSSSSSSGLIVDDAVNYFARFIPRHKLILGLPLYGRSFSNTNGPFTTFEGIPEGTWEKGSYDYKDLPRPGALETYDPEIGASWSYDTRLREFVTYDNAQVAQQKAHYAVNQGLGGCFFWELSGDAFKDDQRNILSTTFYSLGGELDTTPNHLSYPNSKYDNIRAFAV